jgi:hypothetical protein
MKQQRLEAIAAQVTALRIIVTGLVDQLWTPQVKTAIEEHARETLSALPTENEEQRAFCSYVKNELRDFLDAL